jgi:hypothetical protein
MIFKIKKKKKKLRGGYPLGVLATPKNGRGWLAATLRPMGWCAATPSRPGVAHVPPLRWGWPSGHPQLDLGVVLRPPHLRVRVAHVPPPWVGVPPLSTSGGGSLVTPSTKGGGCHPYFFFFKKKKLIYIFIFLFVFFI